ncbi:permease-like cell division protein FtsX [Streptosporangium pseudovulgare]|uniref:RNA polymerase sigma-70 region 2 domain-containing protein n=1 Tax=Streptosporangium pseudovulgare TaxID=35765 RepID=A0ABQ2QJK5_9ACTN|nr:permease-like cell division protein FtsX [Streptosporangium pseudovulgare]GGP84602.1 hypothetical protein GCM10010140_12140 [Streptosporangium pseudovulgare]
MPAPPALHAGTELVAFYRDHRLSLVRLAVLLVGDRETAEDVVQDVFARLHGTWRPGVTTLAYVRTCVLNGSRSVLRRRAVALRWRERVTDPADSAETVGDDHRPLPAPRSRRAFGKGPIRTVAVALAVAATAFGVTRLVSLSSGPQESIVAMTMSGTAPSGTPEVSVFLCKDGDPFPGCEGRGITETERENLRRTLEARPEVEGVAFQDRRQAWEDFRRQNEDDHPELVKAIHPGDMPESFRARIRAGADPSAVARAASGLPGVSNSVDQVCILDKIHPLGSVKEILGLGEQCSFKGGG